MKSTNPDLSSILLLPVGSNQQRPASETEAEMLVLNGSTEESAAHLESLAVARVQILCRCGWRMHVRRRTPPVLAMNPGQREAQLESETSCELCKLLRRRHSGDSGEEIHVEPDSLILCRRVDLSASECIWGDTPWSPGVRPESIHSKLMRWVENTGWNALAAPMPETDLWAAMQRVLRGGSIRLGGHTRIIPREITWTADGAWVGGIETAARQIVRRWPHGAVYRPEIWTLTFVDSVLHRADGAAVLHSTDARGRAYTVEVTCRLPALRTPGPYLALLAGIPDPARGTCTWFKSAMTAIAARNSPIPVESNYERRVVALLQSRGIRFIKPVIARDGLRVDFVLTDAHIVLEVQGLDEPEYLEKKAELMRRIPRTSLYRGWKVIRWDPYIGETIGALAERLAACGL